MYFKTENVTINSAQIVFTLRNTNMQTFYDLLVFKANFNCCKVEGHHLPPQMKNDPNDLNIKLLFICCTKAKRTTDINIKMINMRKLGRVYIYNKCLKG